VPVIIGAAGHLLPTGLAMSSPSVMAIRSPAVRRPSAVAGPLLPLFLLPSFAPLPDHHD
jgi:hypothetical protein